MRRRVAFVPAAPVLLPEYAGIDDPVPALRAACVEAVTWLAKDSDGVVSVVAAASDPANVRRGVDVPVGRRVAEHLLAGAGFEGDVEPSDGSALTGSVLVMCSGSARRGEKAPGHLDERSFTFDEAALRALGGGEPAALGGLDEVLAAELLADGAPGLGVVARSVAGADVVASTLYADDPFGVQYWVVTWECAS